MRWPSAHLPPGTRHSARHGCPIPSPFAEPVQHSSSPSQNLPVVSPQSTQGLGLQSTDRIDMRVPDLSSFHCSPSCSSSLQRRDLCADMPDSRVHSGNAARAPLWGPWVPQGPPRCSILKQPHKQPSKSAAIAQGTTKAVMVSSQAQQMVAWIPQAPLQPYTALLNFQK